MPAIFSGTHDKQLPIQTPFFDQKHFKIKASLGFRKQRCARIDEW